MKSLTFFLLLALVYSAAPIVGAANTPADTPEQFIQGTWHLEGSAPSRRHAWYQDWTFDHGKFKETGYPPLEQEGSYRVLKSVGNKLTVEFYDQQGTFGTENRTVELVINRKKKTLMIDGHGPFRRAAATR